MVLRRIARTGSTDCTVSWMGNQIVWHHGGYRIDYTNYALGPSS